MRKRIILLLMIFAVVISSALYSCTDKPVDVEVNMTDSEGDLQTASDAKDENVSNVDTNTAPDFTVKDSDNNDIKLSDKFGKPIIVNIWATWCGPCLSELPAFNSLADKYKDDISFMMVNLTDNTMDTIDAVKEFTANKGYTFPVYYDTEGSAAQAYNVFSIPLTIFIDENGNVKDQHVGSMSEDILQGYIDELLKKDS
ncbi:MAG: TlpA family protein disulfide reductase [Clostridiales bacterium]|nr:TlpA family protein disulfide reductase [Clostridiales bacterium]